MIHTIMLWKNIIHLSTVNEIAEFVIETIIDFQLLNK